MLFWASTARWCLRCANYIAPIGTQARAKWIDGHYIEDSSCATRITIPKHSTFHDGRLEPEIAKIVLKSPLTFAYHPMTGHPVIEVEREFTDVAEIGPGLPAYLAQEALNASIGAPLYALCDCRSVLIDAILDPLPFDTAYVDSWEPWTEQVVHASEVLDNGLGCTNLGIKDGLRGSREPRNSFL